MAKTNDFSSDSTFNPTPHKLVIAEKPSVARSIANVLGASNKKKGCLEGNGYIVSWCVGHLIALAEPEAYDVKYTVKPWQLDTLPILPQKWKFKVIEETKEQFGILKSLMQNETVYEIICATDAGREGECIFRYVYKLAGCNKPVKRLWISSVEESDIRQGFDNLKDDREYDNLYSSGFARAKADWLVGMNATRLFSAASGAFLSVGRVQTPTLAMIVNRENEINSFQKQKYYTVELNCGAFSVCSEKITELSSAQRIQKNTDENTAFIKSIVTENKKVKPPELFDLTALQKTANISLGYTAQQTLNYAQSLYEKSIITYPRTDSRYVNASMKDKLFKLTEGAADIMNICFESDFKPDIDNVINDKKVSDHHALLPTMSAFDKDKTDIVPEAEMKLLKLICAQLIYAVSPAHIFEAATVTVSCADICFTAQGKKITEMGWKGYQTRILPEITGKEITVQERIFPDITEGLVFENVKSRINEHWTSPPKRYTESTLLAAMERAGNDDYEDKAAEKKGIGSPATRAGIIETIIKRGYVQRTGKSLVPSAKGISLVNTVPEEIKSPKLTAQWEEKLQAIEKGNMTSGEFMNGMAGFVCGLIQKYSNADIRISRKVFGKCPKCGGNVVEYSKMYGCEKRKSCGFKIWKTISGKSLPEGAVLSLLDLGHTAKLKGFKKKDGKGKFDAALVMNDDFTLSFKFK